MSVENYDNRVVHLCMRQLFFWKSLTDTGKRSSQICELLYLFDGR